MVAVAGTLGPLLSVACPFCRQHKLGLHLNKYSTPPASLVRLHWQAVRLCSYAGCYGLLRTSTWLCSVGLQHKLSHRCDGLERGLWGLVWLGTNQVMSDPSGGMTLVAVGVSPCASA